MDSPYETAEGGASYEIAHTLYASMQWQSHTTPNIIEPDRTLMNFENTSLCHSLLAPMARMAYMRLAYA